MSNDRLRSAFTGSDSFILCLQRVTASVDSSILTVKRLRQLEKGTPSERERRKATGLRVSLRQRGYQHGFLLKHHSFACSVSTSLDCAGNYHALFRTQLRS